MLITPQGYWESEGVLHFFYCRVQIPTSHIGGVATQDTFRGRTAVDERFVMDSPGGSREALAERRSALSRDLLGTHGEGVRTPRSFLRRKPASNAQQRARNQPAAYKKQRLPELAIGVVLVVGGALGAAYMMIGAKVQRDISTSTFTSVCYIVCGLSILPIVFLTNSPFNGFTSYEWLLLAGLIFGAQFLGHTLFNFSLKRVSPAVVSLIVFFEVPVSAILAYLWLDQKPPAGTIPGIIGLLFGCALFVLRSNQASNDEKSK